MKLTSKLLALCTAGLALTSASFATTWMDYDAINKTLGGRLARTYSDNFNILEDGYDPTSMEVTKASVLFTFSGLGTVTIDLAQDYWKTQNVFIYGWAIGSLSGSILSNLSAEGVLNYSVTLNTGTAILVNATLCAEGGDRPIGVPDGSGSILLLSLGLIGLVAARKGLR